MNTGDMKANVRRLASSIGRAWWQIAIVASIFVAVRSFVTYLERRTSIEQQQLVAARIRESGEAAQSRRAYEAKRRDDCYDIYARERAQWNNTVGPEYDAILDRCDIRFDDLPGTRNGACEMLKNKSYVELFDSDGLRALRTTCITKTFLKSF